MTQRVFIYARQTGTQPELIQSLRRAVEECGGSVIAVHLDDAQIVGRGKYTAWRKMIAGLNEVDQVVLSSAGDIPGKTMADLLKILAILRDHSVGLYLDAEQIDTASTTFALLEIIAAYRAAKLSEAIRAGQMRARAAGKRIGRPIVPPRVQERIRAALTEGGGVRATARTYGVSPATVINLRKTMTLSACLPCVGYDSRNCGDHLVV